MKQAYLDGVCAHCGWRHGQHMGLEYKCPDQRVQSGVTAPLATFFSALADVTRSAKEEAEKGKYVPDAEVPDAFACSRWWEVRGYSLKEGAAPCFKLERLEYFHHSQLEKAYVPAPGAQPACRAGVLRWLEQGRIVKLADWGRHFSEEEGHIADALTAAFDEEWCHRIRRSNARPPEDPSARRDREHVAQPASFPRTPRNHFPDLRGWSMSIYARVDGNDPLRSGVGSNKVLP